jgi:hypothetical protein
MNEACEAYTGNSLLAAGSTARSQSNSAPKCVIAVATRLTPWQPTLLGSFQARFQETAGVQERGTEKETRSGTSETHDLPRSTGEGHINKMKNAYQVIGSRIAPQYSETVAPVTRGEGRQHNVAITGNMSRREGPDQACQPH